MIKNIENRIKNNEFVLIAEVGVNYYDIANKIGISPLDAAKLMVLRAKNAGIHAVKFQTYKADTIAVRQAPSYWDTSEEAETSQYTLFKKYDSFGVNEYKKIADYAEKIGIEFLSTAFDIEAADYLDELMNVYKISSSDLNNLPFVEYQAKKNKPILLSAGASNLDEIKRSIDLIQKYNNKQIVLMHCVLEYPTPYEHSNLNKIVSLTKEFPKLIIGYSDHTRPDDGYTVLQTAYNLGAKVIEKHFTLDKTLPGNDHYHAMDDNDAKAIINKMEFIDQIKGDYAIKCLDSEKTARKYARRSVVSKCNIKAGDVLTEGMLTFKRPGTGILSENMKLLYGKHALRDIPEDTIITWDMLENTK